MGRLGARSTQAAKHARYHCHLSLLRPNPNSFSPQNCLHQGRELRDSSVRSLCRPLWSPGEFEGKRCQCGIVAAAEGPVIGYGLIRGGGPGPCKGASCLPSPHKSLHQRLHQGQPMATSPCCATLVISFRLGYVQVLQMRHMPSRRVPPACRCHE